ncbi:MAG: DivIVA domain-containing protein [Coriobacteriales bacterium]|jgi:cell division initiation protein
MSITALDIQNEGFEHSLRGYDVEQVDDFLERVANEVDAMNNEIAELHEKLDAAEAELAERENAEEEEAEEEESSEEAESTQDLAAARQEEFEALQTEASEARARADKAEERLRAVEERARKAEDALEPLKEQLEEKSKLDNAISEAFISAQRSADQLIEDARAESDRIYREAEEKARQFIREALAKKGSVLNEIDALQQSADEFRGRYVSMLERFTTEARENFADMDAPEISDDEIDEQLPDVEDMPGLPTEEGETPRLSADTLPEIEPDENVED